MYASNYSPFQPGQAPPGFNPGAPHTPQPQTPQQHLMYNNAQQFSSGGPPHQSPYGGNPNQMNPNMMMPNGPMMQNGGMAHMGGNNGIAPPYQTPYTSSPYGQGIAPSSSAGPSHQGPFMPPTSSAGQFMPPQNMTPQPHQRMQPPVSTPISSSQRASPFNGAPHGTPPQAQQQSQFMTPQNVNPNQQPQNHTPMQNQQGIQNPQSAGVQTPQTPSFPNNTGSAGGTAPPLSPGSESRERVRVTVLLDINKELLLEVMRLKGVQAEAKKEAEASTDAKKGDIEEAKAAATTKEYVDCMRRLQYNLAYLAAIADRTHKPLSQLPPHPAIMMAPVLTILPKARPSPAPKKEDSVKDESASGEASDSKSVTTPNEPPAPDRIVVLQGLYKRLQSLFPDVKDYTKEPPMQPIAPKAKPAQHGQNPAANNPQNKPPNTNPNPGSAQSHQQQPPKMASQPQSQQNNQSHPQQPNQGMNLNASAMQAHQMQAQQLARQQQAQMMASQNAGGQNMNPAMGGFNPNMMAGGMGMNMANMNNMNMQGMQGINPNMMNYGGGGAMGGQGNMMGPGQGMGLAGMNSGMMGMGMQPPNNNQQGGNGGGSR